MRKSYLIVLALLLSASLHAQNAQSSFLLENYVFGYRYNPAYVPEKSFVAIPAVSNINPSVKSQVGLSSIFYPTANGGLVTGLNDQVSSEQFLGKFKRQNNLVNIDLNESLIAFGFRGNHGGYSTVELNVRASARANLPYEMFSFLKDNGEPSYDVSSADLGATAYIELAYGYHRAIGDKINFGATLKALVGAANVNFNVNSATVSCANGEIYVQADAEAYGAANFLTVGTKVTDDGQTTDIMDLSDIGFKSGYAPSGYGAAVDLGVIYKPIDWLEINLAVTDLGGISWKNNLVGRTNAEVSYKGERVSPEDSDGNTAVGHELNAALETIKSLAEFHYDPEETVNSFQMLPCTVNAGVKARMPFYRNLTFGGSVAYRFGRSSSWYDARAGFAINPAKFFSFTGNAGYSTFGPVCGAGLSINAGPIALFTVFDGYIGRIAKGTFETGDKIFYPVNSFNYSLNIGLAIQFGQRVRAF